MSKAWEKQQGCGTKWTKLIVPVLDLQPNQTTKKATNAWAVGRLGQRRACSRMRRRYNCCCTQCPSSDIHLRLAFPLAVCINSIRKPLATQTIHFEAHPNITHDLTDNACLIRGKHIGYISNMDSWAVAPFLFSNWMLWSKSLLSLLVCVSWPGHQARTGKDSCWCLDTKPTYSIWLIHTTCVWHQTP